MLAVRLQIFQAFDGIFEMLVLIAQLDAAFSTNQLEYDEERE